MLGGLPRASRQMDGNKISVVSNYLEEHQSVKCRKRYYLQEKCENFMCCNMQRKVEIKLGETIFSRKFKRHQ